MPAIVPHFTTEMRGSGHCGSGFSREEGGLHSRLKPLPQVVVFCCFSRAWPAPTTYLRFAAEAKTYPSDSSGNRCQ